MNPILSDREAGLLALLKIGIPVRTDVLAKQHFGDDLPPNAHKRLIARLRLVEDKLQAVNSDIRICKSKRNGPHPISIWIEKETRDD